MLVTRNIRNLEVFDGLQLLNWFEEPLPPAAGRPPMVELISSSPQPKNQRRHLTPHNKAGANTIRLVWMPMGERSGMWRDTARSQQGLAPARRLGAAFAIGCLC